MKEITSTIAEESGKKAGSMVLEDIYKMFVRPRLEKINGPYWCLAPLNFQFQRPSIL